MTSSRTTLLTDALVLGLCTLGFAACLLLFWNDLNATFYKLGDKPIGTITFRYNTAQRRFIDRVVWDRLRNDSPVYNGDIIRTAGLSEATITFVGGSIVDLYSNTLVQIFMDKIDFNTGGISINASSASSGMVIESGNNLLSIDSGAVVRADSLLDGAFDLTVNEGAAVLGSASGSQTSFLSRAITAGEAVFVNTQGVAVNSPRAVAVFPLPNARLINNAVGALPVEFSWNKINYQGDEQTRLEIAHDRNFRRILFTGSTAEDHLLAAIPEGTYFWRLHPAGESSYSRITVVHSPAPTLITPADGQVFSYRNKNPQVRFQWTSTQDAVSYLLEAANNQSFQNPVVSVQVRAGSGGNVSVNSQALSGGTWYWRITPVYSRSSPQAQDDASSVSRTGTFIIEQNIELSVPVLTAPAPGAYLNIETGRRDILFSWKKENEAVSYVFKVSANSNMSSPIMEKTVTDTFYRYGRNDTDISTGVWYWTVHQIGQNAAASAPSQPRMFTALQGELVHRAIFPPQDYVVADSLLPDTRFTWKTNLAACRFQVSRSADFSQILINESALAEAYTISSLQGGEYYWRITAGYETQRTSPARRFVVAEALPPPELGDPESGSSSRQKGLIVLQYGDPVAFKWNNVEDADYYSFKIYRGDSTTDPIYETLVNDTELSVLMDNYADGIYTWTVQSLARESTGQSRRVGLSSSQIVTIKNPLSAPENCLPQDGFIIEPAQIRVSRSVDFSWDSVQGANYYILTIFQGSGAARRTLLQTPMLARTSYTVDDIRLLGRGDLFWHVEALYVLSDGFIELNGLLRENRLNINIPAPTRTQTIDSGVLYGN